MDEICSICSKIFKNKHRLRTHKSAVHSEKKYACDVCDKKFKKKDQLNTHVSTHRDPIDIYYECGITFTHKNNWTKYMKIYHLPQNYKCSHCPKSSIDKKHLESIHAILNRIEKKIEKISNPTTRYWFLLKEYENLRKSDMSIFAKTKRGPYKKRKTVKAKKVTFRWKKK